MIALAGCSPRQRIVVVGAKSMELMMDLQRRGYFLAASAGNCGLPAAQYDAALVDWRRRPLSALDAAMDWLDGFLGPRAVLVIWLDAQKSQAKDIFAPRWRSVASSSCRAPNIHAAVPCSRDGRKPIRCKRRHRHAVDHGEGGAAPRLDPAVP
ncbi:hypothetical protein [Bradyrhizobium sp. B117]|uniref:hypothetical protein n=1 Tax=Bradyrhizobium sp. B117 TaxID=3140246 RepID=UPI00318313B1